MINILSLTTKNHQKNTFQGTSLKVEEIQGLAQKSKDF